MDFKPTNAKQTISASLIFFVKPRTARKRGGKKLILTPVLLRPVRVVDDDPDLPVVAGLAVVGGLGVLAAVAAVALHGVVAAVVLLLQQAVADVTQGGRVGAEIRGVFR